MTLIANLNRLFKKVDEITGNIPDPPTGATLNLEPVRDGVIPDYILSDINDQISKPEIGEIHTDWLFINRENAPTEIKSFLQGDEVSFWITTVLGNIKIYSGGEVGFVNALYQLLYEWGFRFYNYTEAYTKVPKEFKQLNIDKGYRPAIRNKEFAGTGGMGIFGYGVPVQFKNRNGWTADFHDPGHLFDRFYTRFKKEIEIDPTIMCSGGDNWRYRLNVDNPKTMELVKLWVDEMIATNPYVIGAGPSDGMGWSGDCASSTIPEITPGQVYEDGHVLTQDEAHAVKNWWIANEMAKYIDEKYPESRTMIDYYAYGDGPYNAAPPHFALNKRMFVRMIPYAFQTTFANDEHMVEVWGEKAKKEGFKLGGFYDYWSITQWSNGRPQRIPIKRIAKWKSWDFDSLNIETTHSIWTGMWQWITGQFLSNSTLSIDELYNQYINDNFGVAAPQAKKLFDFWQANKGDSVMYFPESFRLINEVTLANDNYAAKDLRAYGVFLDLHFKYRVQQTEESYIELMDYMIRSRDNYIVQPWATDQYYTPPPAGVTPITYSSNPEDWPELNTDAEVEAMYQEILANLPAPYYSSSMEFDYTKATFKEPLGDAWKYGRSAGAILYPTHPELKFKAGNGNECTVVLFDKNGRIVLKDVVGPDNHDDKRPDYYLKTFSVMVTPGEYYYLSVKPGFNKVEMLTDEIVYSPNHPDAFDNAGFPWHYFYVPQDMQGQRLLYADPIGANRFLFMDEGPWNDESKVEYGEAVPDRPGVFSVKIKDEWVGKVIRVSSGYPGYSLLNVPNVFALNRFDYEENPI